MITRLAPNTLRAVPEQYQGIYVHGTQVLAPKTLVCLSGQIGVSPEGETREGFEQQCFQAMSNVEALLADAGLDAADILRVVYYVTDAKFLPTLSNARQVRWNQGHAPAVTTLVVAGLAAPDLLVEIEVTAAR
ncbi:RidA family protein [Ruegeria atlantica]|uniref:RidA family protein n=1 Tax=Ruegeria atlantica TaxID=81569 RepID=UPI00147E471B|nr:RidA family protein [Ruegeria atlantica]